MRPATLFKEYIWLINAIHRHQRLTFEEINQHWVKTDMSGGLPMARSTFNRHLAPMACRYREAMPPRRRQAV